MDRHGRDSNDMELKRYPVDRFRHGALLTITMLLGPIGLLIWLLSRAGLDDD